MTNQINKTNQETYKISSQSHRFFSSILLASSSGLLSLAGGGVDFALGWAEAEAELWLLAGGRGVLRGTMKDSSSSTSSSSLPTSEVLSVVSKGSCKGKNKGMRNFDFAF